MQFRLGLQRPVIDVVVVPTFRAQATQFGPARALRLVPLSFTELQALQRGTGVDVYLVFEKCRRRCIRLASGHLDLLVDRILKRAHPQELGRWSLVGLIVRLPLRKAQVLAARGHLEFLFVFQVREEVSVFG